VISPELRQAFPIKRLKPEDGMAVTAQLWEEAHDYHRQNQRFHNLFGHGPGIVTGLEVIASDPPDTSVYILPGMAIDSAGQSIFLAEPLTYDVGTRVDGLLYLLLSYGEGSPRPGEPVSQDGGTPLYVHTEFVIQAIPDLPDTPYVELARVRRVGRDAYLLEAKDAMHPGINEIDQRYRHPVGAPAQEVLSVAVAYAGGTPVARHARGMSTLARTLSQSRERRVFVDDNVALAPGLENYDLVYLVGQSEFQLSSDEMGALHTFMQGGGTLFIESCRRDMALGEPPSDASFMALISALGVQMEELRAGHPLLTGPNLFASVPQGFETQGTPSVRASEGVVFSACDYGCLWQGERRSGAASREQIRSAQEWGANLVAYALERRRTAKPATEVG
jgi:hypothetical protein